MIWEDLFQSANNLEQIFYVHADYEKGSYLVLDQVIPNKHTPGSRLQMVVRRQVRSEKIHCRKYNVKYNEKDNATFSNAAARY